MSITGPADGEPYAGEEPRRWGNAHPSIVPYQTVRAADGHLMVAVGNDLQFRSLARVLEEPAWADDPRFATNPERVRHREARLPLIEERFSRRPAAPGMVLSLSGLPMVAPVPKLSRTPAAVASIPPRLAALRSFRDIA